MQDDRRHARPQVVAFAEIFFGHALREVLALLTIAFRRRDDDIEAIAFRFPGHRLLEPRDDVAMAEQDSHRFVAR